MEEKKEMTDMIVELNDVSKNVGTMGFSVKYTATPGNIRIHKAFKQFAFDQANNEYLLAIGKLLEYGDLFKYYMVLDDRLTELEKQLKVINDGVQNKKEEVKEKGKTF